jgi:hypothetical protein
MPADARNQAVRPAASARSVDDQACVDPSCRPIDTARTHAASRGRGGVQRASCRANLWRADDASRRRGSPRNSASQLFHSHDLWIDGVQRVELVHKRSGHVRSRSRSCWLPDAGHRSRHRLGGCSFGGVVAYAVAQRLAAGGREIALLALLDPYVVHNPKSRDTLGRRFKRLNRS